MTDITALTQGARLPPAWLRRRIREEAGVGVSELADLLGVSRFSVWRWETGRAKPHGDARRLYAGALRAMRQVVDDG